MYLPTDSFYISYFCDFVFLKDLDCDLLLCKKMDSLFHFAEGTLSQGSRHAVAAYNWLLLLLGNKFLGRQIGQKLRTNNFAASFVLDLDLVLPRRTRQRYIQKFLHSRVYGSELVLLQVHFKYFNSNLY